ncbi:MAG: hypothetical protein Q9165_003191 [Trypethelium subeluteriae]
MTGVLSKLKRRCAAAASKHTSSLKSANPISNPSPGQNPIINEAQPFPSSPGQVSNDIAVTISSSEIPNTLGDQSASNDEQHHFIGLPSESSGPCTVGKEMFPSNKFRIAAQATAAAAMSDVTAAAHGQISLVGDVHESSRQCPTNAIDRSIDSTDFEPLATGASSSPHIHPSKATNVSVSTKNSNDGALKTRKVRPTVRKFRKACGKATRNVGKAISSLFPESHHTSTRGSLSRGTQTVSTGSGPYIIGTRVESKIQDSSIDNENVDLAQTQAPTSGDMQSSESKSNTTDIERDHEALDVPEEDLFAPKNPANDRPVQAKLQMKNDNIDEPKNIVTATSERHDADNSAASTPSEANLGDEDIDGLKGKSHERPATPSKEVDLASNKENSASDRARKVRPETVPENQIVEDEIFKSSSASIADENLDTQRENFEYDAHSAQLDILLSQAGPHHSSTLHTIEDASKSSSAGDRIVDVSEENFQYGAANISNETLTENETKGVKISIEKLEELALQARFQLDDNTAEYEDLHAKYLGTSGGNNNRVHLMEYNDGLKVCIRVPDCGEPGKWFANDARSLSSSVMTMAYISRHMRNIPIPRILDFDDTLDNIINAPYTIMTYMEGHNVEELWFDDSLPVPREVRRQNILRSLATAMADLRTHSYSWMGILDLSEGLWSPTPGPIFDRNFGEHRGENFDASDGAYTRKWTESLRAAMKERIEDWSEANEEHAYRNGDEAGAARIMGSGMPYEILVEQLPELEKGSLQYFLAHPDIDFQNLLADEEGNITAILDWDRVDTAPAFLGWACQPHWLGEDWSGEYVWPDIFGSHAISPTELDHYRTLYAGYLRQAANGHECVQFTRASSMMYAIYTQFGGRYHYDVLFEVLDQIVPQLGRNAYLERVAHHGFAPGEKDFLREAVSLLYRGASGLLRA